MTTTPSEPAAERDCSTCVRENAPVTHPICWVCIDGPNDGRGLFPDYEDARSCPELIVNPDTQVGGKDHRETLPAPSGSLPDDAAKRNEYPMADGLLDYFPNALAEVARLSHLATQQHHPDQPMHWDRSKSTDHRNKIMRHLIDTDTVDDKGIDHWAMVCWRALAGYQTYLEKKHGLRPSRASKNLPTN